MHFAKSIRTPAFLCIFISVLLLVRDAGMYKYYFGFVLHACLCLGNDRQCETNDCFNTVVIIFSSNGTQGMQKKNNKILLD